MTAVEHSVCPCIQDLCGRLRGRKKKLPVRMTEEFVVSFKALAGALLLELGTDGMWSVLSVLFDELLEVSPSDLMTRYYGQESTLVKAYRHNDTQNK